MVQCRKCRSTCEPVIKAGREVFHFCRTCKIPHDQNGSALFTGPELKSFFNPLSSVREIVSKTNPGATAVARTALEVLLMQSLWDAYFAGIKDGVLLSYSQDFKPGEPLTSDST